METVGTSTRPAVYLSVMFVVVCLCLCVVSYTMDTMYFQSLDDPVQVAPEIQMPQFGLVDWKVIDCSQNYTSGFYSLIHMSTSCLDSFPLHIIANFSFITFCVSRRRRKMYCGDARLCVCVCVCVCPRPYAHTTARTRM